MSKNTIEKRSSFSSSIGFVLSAAGSAIGLGNLWKFPYVAGSSGGGVFLIFYIIFTILLGLPIILAEIAIGRKTQLSSVAAYKKLNKDWGFIGLIGVICGFVILSYYSVVGGWIIKYITKYITGGNFGTNKSEFFNSFIQSPAEPVTWHVIFIIVCAIIVLCGIDKGIEKASKIMLPALFVIIVILTIRSVTLKGSIEGLKFFFIPRKESFTSFSSIANSLVEAMGQVFFSLSLGIGVTITYGSYLQKNSNIQKDTVSIAILDTLMAIFSGVLILPAVFAFNIKPTAGPGLIFEALPTVFDSMPFGSFIGLIFFILVFFAAVTSAIALLEVVVSYLIDSWGWIRRDATILVAGIIGFSGVFVSLSMGTLSNVIFFGMNLFDLLAYFSDKILMPLSAGLMCVFVGHIIGVDEIADEISHGEKGFKYKKAFEVSMKYIAPSLIGIIFIIGLFR